MTETITEEIYFYPQNFELYWPGIELRTGAPYLILKVTYTDTGCMILDNLAFPRRELIMFNSAAYSALLTEVTDYIARYNTLELC